MTGEPQPHGIYEGGQQPESSASGRHSIPLHVTSSSRNSVKRHCWEVIQSPDNDLHGTCEECYAHFVQQDCWSLWALRDAGHKPCCQKQQDCATCPVLLQQVTPKKEETVQVRAQMPTKPRGGSAKEVCRYLDAIDVPVSPDSEQYVSAVSRAVQARYSTFRCRLRGVHLDMGYVSDMCVSRHIQDCVFLEEAHPEVSVSGGEYDDDKLPHGDHDDAESFDGMTRGRE